MSGLRTAPTNDLRGLARLTGDVIDVLTEPIADLHHAIAGRSFRLAAPAARPVQVVHDGICRAVYSSVRVAGGGMGRVAGGMVAALSGGRDVTPITGRARGRAVIAAVNGVLGDRLADDGNDLALPFTLHRQGSGPVTGRVAVLVHGLCETDRSWRRAAGPTGDPAALPDYAAVLVAQGWTVHAARYNTGRPIAANGRDLAEHLERLVTGASAPVTDLALVGHSMGGLVARSAVHQAATEGHSWPATLSSCVYLGSPHRGASLERVVVAGVSWAGRLAEARPLGTVLDVRSEGIKDLADGRVLPGGQRPPLHAHARHVAVAASVGPSPGGWSAHVLGDGLVSVASATRPGHRRPEPGDPPVETLHLPRVTHLGLLNHPEIRARLAGWLEREPAPVAPEAGAP